VWRLILPFIYLLTGSFGGTAATGVPLIFNQSGSTAQQQPTGCLGGAAAAAAAVSY